MTSDPLFKLRRATVWCAECGHMEKLARAPEWHLANGWPKHCGYTMTIDSPEERAALQPREAPHD